MSNVSYKPYHNEKLKEVDYHGQKIHPLYIRMNFAADHLRFKSLYFNLFSNKNKAVHAGRVNRVPTIKEILKLEDEVITFIIDKLGDGFTLKKFEVWYKYYTQDLCAISEDVYNDFLRIYLSDIGVPAFARSLFEGNKNEIIYQVVDDMGLIVQEATYNKLIVASYNFTPPYLLIYAFAKHLKKWPVILPMIEWENESTQERFVKYLNEFYKIDTHDVLSRINAYLDNFSPKT